MTGVVLATQSISVGQLVGAFCTGANFVSSCTQSVFFVNQGLVCADGRCKSFDQAANGYMRAEACGVALLQNAEEVRTSQSVRVRGYATNSSGHTSRRALPAENGQKSCIVHSLKVASIEGHAVDSYEAQGTGTVLSDTVEAKSVCSALGSTERRCPLLLHTVKTIIGHTERASGVIGLTRSVMSLMKNYVPPHLNLKLLCSHIGTPILEKTRHAASLSKEFQWH